MPASRVRLLQFVLTICFLIALINTSVSAQYTLRIGVIDKPDGSMLAGALLAAKHINDAGGIVGADGTVFHLAVVDTLPDNMNIATANMRQARVIAVIGPETNNLLARNMSSLQAVSAPIFTPATGDTVLLPDISKRIFRSRAQESLQIRGLADFLVNTLAVRTIRTIQLDADSTASLISLANALAAFGVRPSNLLYEERRMNLEQIAESIVQSASDAVAIFGPPGLAAQVYNHMRTAGYQGDVVYNRAEDPEFVEIVPAVSLPGIISASTWSYTLDDLASREFTLAFTRAFGQLPDALSAASYDAVLMVAEASSKTGAIYDELAAMRSFSGVQGELSPADLLPGETSNNVVVTRINEYGTANVVARYSGLRQNNEAVPVIRESPVPVPTATPPPTATPMGYHLTVKSTFQNVRSGPGLQYEVIGQVLQNTQARVLGATVDYAWLVIDFRGQWGWLAGYLVDTFGDRNLVPIIQPPATPTPVPSETPAPPRDPDLLVLHANPSRITLGQQTTVNVTLLNQGLAGAGNFAIASTFEPGAQYVGVNLSGLAAGQQTIAPLQLMVDGPSGPQSVVIVVDLNGEVFEGPSGEANNRVFSYNYIADRPILTSGTWTISAGSIDLDGDANPDFSWTGNDLVALGNAAMVLMNHFGSIADVHYDAIDVPLANIKTLNADLLSNAMIGLLTADGHRGVMRLANVTRNGSITVEYRVYR